VIRILKAGPGTTIQAGRRLGLRHRGVPWSGPADAVSMALANRLVGNAADAPALEITLGGAAFEFEAAGDIALAGAQARFTLTDETVSAHRRIRVAPGDRLAIGVHEAGARLYLAATGGFRADAVLGSASTYLPAGFGGLDGRALRDGDRLEQGAPGGPPGPAETPMPLRLSSTHAYALRALPGPEGDRPGADAIWSSEFVVGRAADRMGVRLEGPAIATAGAGAMASAPVFPGTVQLPEGGAPILLGPDAQTTGGYPRIASVIRADRHLIGQIRPGDRVRFLQRSAAEAEAILRAKAALLAEWVPDIARVF